MLSTRVRLPLLPSAFEELVVRQRQERHDALVIRGCACAPAFPAWMGVRKTKLLPSAAAQCTKMGWALRVATVLASQLLLLLDTTIHFHMLCCKDAVVKGQHDVGTTVVTATTLSLVSPSRVATMFSPARPSQDRCLVATGGRQTSPRQSMRARCYLPAKGGRRRRQSCCCCCFMRGPATVSGRRDEAAAVSIVAPHCRRSPGWRSCRVQRWIPPQDGLEHALACVLWLQPLLWLLLLFVWK